MKSDSSQGGSCQAIRIWSFASVELNEAMPSSFNDLAQGAYAPYISCIGRRPAPMDGDYGEKMLGATHSPRRPASGRMIGMIRRSDHLLAENVAVDPDK